MMKFRVVSCVVISLGCVLVAVAQTPGVPASVVVTLEPKHGKEIPAVEQQDINVSQGKDHRPVTGLTALAKADTQFLLLIDDSTRGTFDTQIQTLKQFIGALPEQFEVAVGYMRNGMTQVTQNFTGDHAAAANSIRIPAGSAGSNVSPYDSLTDAVKKWPGPGAQRKEVLMISSGIEGLGGGYTSDNPYVNAGIESAVKAGVVVYSIYSPSEGHEGHSFRRNTWGQNFLSQLADETGGEAYWQGFGPPVSFQPYLDQFLEAQQHQYLLSFLAKPVNKAGLQAIRVSVDSKDVSVAAPGKVFVKASL